MRKKSYYRSYIFIFFLICALLLFAYAVNGIYPFGGNSVLTSDMRTQHIGAAAAFFGNLRTGKNLFITWNGGLGVNLYALALYVLCDPLNVIFLFFDTVYYQEVFLAAIIIKTALAGVFFSVFLKNSRIAQTEEPLALTVLSLCYALSICTMKAAINPMWLGNIALLPLVLLGIENVIENKSFLLFYISTALCFITNYYMAFITALTAMIYFAYYCIVTGKDAKKVFKSFLLCGVTALLAAAAACFVLLPSYLAISDTYTDIVGTGSKSGIFRFAPKDICLCFLYVISDRTSSGNPNAYFGILPLMLAVGGFSIPFFKKREKTAAVAVILIYVLSLVFEPFYLVWHLFRAPTGFDGRFLYGAALFMLLFAARAYRHIEGINRNFIAVVWLVLFAAANYAVFGNTNIYYTVMICLLTVFTAAYVFFTVKRYKRALLVLLAVEMAVSCVNCVRIIKLWDGYAPHDEYIKYTTEYKSGFADLAEKDTGFYRADADIPDNYNVSMSSDYRAINHYSSLANQSSFEAMRRLGVTSATDNKILTTQAQNVVLDSLFGIKYFAVTNKDALKEDSIGRECVSGGLRITTPYYNPVFESGNMLFYENKEVFPLMFAVDGDIAPEGENAFETQSSLFGKMFGIDTSELYRQKSFDNVTAINCNADVVDGDIIDISLAEGKTIAETQEETGRLTFEYEADEDGNYFTVLDGEFADNVSVPLACSWSINGTGINILDMHGELRDLGYFKKGDKLILTCDNFINTRIRLPKLYVLNGDVFEKISEKANENGLSDIREENGDIVAKSNFGKDATIFSSISYDKGFHVYVDGQETEKLCLANGFLGFKLPQGGHSIRIKYISRGAIPGAIVSCAALVLFIIVYFTVKIRRKK